LDALETETDEMRTNQAIIAIRQAADHNDVKYSLQDRTIDTYYDASGIDATPSTNHILAGGAYHGITVAAPPTGGTIVSTGGTNGVPSGYTVLKFISDAALTVTTAGNVSILAVGGGGSGGSYYAGGGGAGGLVYDAVYAVTANTYDIVIGDGGAARTGSTGQLGDNGVDTTVTIASGSSLQFTAKGGAGGGFEATGGAGGGSGGGAGYSGTAGGTTQAGTSQHGTVDVNIGYVGGVGVAASGGYNPGGGGGAGGAGDAGDSSASGDGGLGYNASAVFGTAVGEGGYFASGGGGGYTVNTPGANQGTSQPGGGGAGATSSADGEAGQANTGGGSGGGASVSGYKQSGTGGSGVVLVSYSNGGFGSTTYNDITLQSTDTTAEAAPTKADMVMLMEDSVGTATINTDIKGYVSRDSGVTFIEGVLVDEGDWGTNKRILAFHDLSFTGASGTAMCYKITTHNQSASIQTKIHATSIGWK
jgi:hypothetical protein